ncbi:protein kinase [Streptomyces sp. NBRC 109706]|uniref:protein kinase n=1 Tax=Streptomyces sp. NBRC 109706 TaxID=1550035 RepID=UPI001F204F2F|nr:protein kinase [Streptomyces sp. NBRC 109706]
MRNKNNGRRDQLLREKAINPFVRGLAPELLWSAEDADWIVLGFERIEARDTDFGRGSPDVPVLVELVNRIGELELPEVAREWPETRWDWWADRGAPELFRGDTFLHVDINPGNLLIGADRNWVVDWSWPGCGAAFIDPAMLVLQLIGGLHTPAEAESWVAGCPAWMAADPKAIDAFVVATARMNRHRALRRPDEPWLDAMAVAAESWATHRELTVYPD